MLCWRMAGMADDDRLNGLLLKLGAVLVAICAATTFALVYYTIDEHDETYDFKVVFMRLTDCGLGLLPTFEPSDIEKPGLNIFLMHIFFMALAFALLGPIGAVAYVLAEDVLKLPHSVAKWMHALIQFGALAASILGFVEMYYKHLGSCDGAFHFQSLHSHIGIVVLAMYWLQWLLGAVVFSNNLLLAPGTFGRNLFHKVHITWGATCVFLGLGTVITGLLIYGGKLPMPAIRELDPTKYEKQFKGVRAGMFAFFTALALVAVLSLKSAAPSRKLASQEDQPSGALDYQPA